MRVVRFSDAHSTLTALDAVLADTESRRVAYEVERIARAIEASELPSVFGGQLHEARGDTAPA